MKVKGNHPLAEVLAKSLFSIETVPPKEAARMVRRAIKEAVAYHTQEVERYRQYIIDDNNGIKKSKIRMCMCCFAYADTWDQIVHKDHCEVWSVLKGENNG